MLFQELKNGSDPGLAVLCCDQSGARSIDSAVFQSLHWLLNALMALLKDRIGLATLKGLLRPASIDLVAPGHPSVLIALRDSNYSNKA